MRSINSRPRLYKICFWLITFTVISTLANAKLRITNTIEGKAAYPWAKVELLEDSNASFKKQIFHLESKRKHSLTQKAFQTTTPASNQVLVHYAPNWNKAKFETPIILVHGAGDNASRGFCHPWSFDIPKEGQIKKPGIMQFLSNKGYAVFAVTYSHPHGDNFYQAQQLANVISRVKQVTKKKKVDLLCHSKGAMSTRIYTSSLGKEFSEYSWITPFRNDVRKILFVASPLKGLDTAFRYYAYNFTVKQQSMAAPMGARRMMWYGIYSDEEMHNIAFPGQFQMLHNWVKDGIPLSKQSYTPDMNVSMRALYNGGVTSLLVSDGIDNVAKAHGNVIDKLNQKGINPAISCYILAGSKQTIQTNKIGWLEIPIGEFADDSDGVLFLKSATYKKGLTARGAKVKKVKVLNTHHVGVTVLPEALQYINEVLSD
jgi:pimeloyl-ACP methyl ester carboxylesterase